MNQNSNKQFALYKQARNRLRKCSPDSVLTLAVEILHKAAHGGAEVLTYYQPWNVLLLIKWSLEEADSVSHRRPAATLNDLHSVLNVLHDIDGCGPFPDSSQHVYLFMRRIAFQEFWLQYAIDGDAIARQELLFCKLPNAHAFQRDFAALTGVSCADFTQLAFALISLFVKNKNRRIVRRENFATLNPAFVSRTLNPFLSVLSRDIPSLHSFLTVNLEQRRLIADQMFLPTPLLNFPLWKRGLDYIPYSPMLLMRSLETFIYRTLKNKGQGEFSAKFGGVFERHIHECLKSAGLNFFDEEFLKKSLANYGKCVDFLIVEDGCNLLIDAKGVEVSKLGRISQDAAIVFQSVKSSAKSGIEQGQDTARRIAATQPPHPTMFGTKQNYLLVVTLDALFLGSNAEFAAMFGQQVVADLESKFGAPLPIPLENIFFLTVAEFERLLGMVHSKSTTIVKALQYAQAKDASHQTRRFAFHQHLEELSPKVNRLPNMQRAVDELCDRCESLFQS